MSDKETIEEPILIPAERVYPPDLQTYFVVDMVIQHQQDHFILSFFEVFPPPVLGTPEERSEAIKKLSSVEAKCVARLVVPPRRMKEFMDLMNENYGDWRKRNLAAQDESAEIEE